ncbi:MAG: hypothetical protein QW407_03330 [Thermofilaceae archaeon]
MVPPAARGPVETVRVTIPPVYTEVDGARVQILEVAPYTALSGEKRFMVVCRIEMGGYRTKAFTVDVRSNAELEQKLRREVALMRVYLLSGETSLFERVG